jgi:alpha-tubulin suppressor-like RCC1 family protein
MGFDSCPSDTDHLQYPEDGQIWGSGCNTDGQLGLGDGQLNDVYQLTRMELPHEVIKQGGVRRIRSGADTSVLITESGQLWTWGNSVRSDVP